MAKESKTQSKTQKINPYILAAISAVLLAAGWSMRSFPVLIFAAIAPLFAITDHADEKNFWNKIELVAVVFGIGMIVQFWAYGDVPVISVVLQSMAVGFVFLAYTYSRRGLGNGLGKLSLILFWLAMEYILLKFFLNHGVSFLGSALNAKREWLYWTKWTGSLGVSLWVLIANWVLYLGLLKNGLRIPYLLLFLIVIVGPIFYSYTLRADFAKGTADGEWIPRTAAWISVLILLSAIVKDYIRKK